jgi:hypothetical protein
VTARLGLLVGAEQAFAEALWHRAKTEAGVRVELVEIGGTDEHPVSRWDAILDRTSAVVPHYRTWLRAVAVAGAAVVNDPWRSDVDGFVGVELAARADLRVPRTVLLPQKSYGPGVDRERGLRNLQYPLAWQAVLDYVKLPALLRTVSQPFVEVLVHDRAELGAAYDRSGERLVLLQEVVEGSERLRCVHAGTEVAVLGPAAPEIERRVAAEARRLGAATGLDLWAFDVAVRKNEIFWLAGPDPWPPLEPRDLGASFERTVGGVLAGLLRAARRG